MDSPKGNRNPMGNKKDEIYSDIETARRRDEVIRRMANTPPKPRVKSPSRQSGKRKSTGRGRADRKPSADKGA